MAVWFHDAIFDVHSRENERRSAELARECLAAAGWSAAAVATVERIVLDTEQHLPSIPEARTVIDLDLASLGAEWSVFASNTAALRCEFSHVDEARFAAGQRRMCERFLGRDVIYHTDWGQAFEAQARKNLKRCLSEHGGLTGPSGQP